MIKTLNLNYYMKTPIKKMCRLRIYALITIICCLRRDVNDHKWWGFDIELVRYRTDRETFRAVCVLIER